MDSAGCRVATQTVSRTYVATNPFTEIERALRGPVLGHSLDLERRRLRSAPLAAATTPIKMLSFIRDMLWYQRDQKHMVLGLIFIVSSLIKVDSYNKISDHVGKSSQRLVGCWPYSEAYLTSSYFAPHKSLFDSDCHGYLAEEFGSGDLCKGMANEISLLQLSDLQRRLRGEGSHRHLTSTLRFMNRSYNRSLLDSQDCKAVIIERLPIGVFADPFELQHLVDRKVFLDAAVFGDTNLELPSALSNRSIVEVHINIGIENPLRSYETVMELPLHARYPPLDDSGYAQVQFGHPDLFLHCRSKEAHSESCLWTLSEVNAGPAVAVMWRVPSGNDAHRGIVSSVTFVSALVCALSLVVSAITSRNKDVQETCKNDSAFI
ncbi:hypothetical protein OPV22_021882 [Ensete ventricosum]|uniref:Phosphatidylinositol-glycan biosynthesis class X protein n=1 Tax=Ensete ventricosum TaxID=4639 RepID=A0AAV8QJZ3_ENSVE|nr:hypothetical protein OPV22_021882 [Ensete ventricosum]